MINKSNYKTDDIEGISSWFIQSQTFHAMINSEKDEDFGKWLITFATAQALDFYGEVKSKYGRKGWIKVSELVEHFPVYLEKERELYHQSLNDEIEEPWWDK